MRRFKRGDRFIYPDGKLYTVLDMGFEDYYLYRSHDMFNCHINAEYIDAVAKPVHEANDILKDLCSK